MDNPKEMIGMSKAPMESGSLLADIEMRNVFATGAYKYGRFNYRDAGVVATTYIGAINRHWALWQDGVDSDQESGMSHLAHIMCCCAILIDGMYAKNITDDRSKTGRVESLLEKSAKLNSKTRSQL